MDLDATVTNWELPGRGRGAVPSPSFAEGAVDLDATVANRELPGRDRAAVPSDAADNSGGVDLEDGTILQRGEKKYFWYKGGLYDLDKVALCGDPPPEEEDDEYIDLGGSDPPLDAADNSEDDEFVDGF